MQSTGQACTHNSSLVQVSVITYAMLARTAIPVPAPNRRKQGAKINSYAPVGGAKRAAAGVFAQPRLSDAGFAAGGDDGFAARGLTVGGGGEAPDLVGDANQEHGLAGVLEQIDDAVGRLFQENGFAVGEQMNIRGSGESLGEPLSHVFLQEAEHAANFLQRKALAAQLGNHRDLNHFLGHVNALMPVLPRRDDAAFIPPLQLTQADAGAISE